MVNNLWRQRRGLIAESAEIRRNTEFLEFDRQQNALKDADGISQKSYEVQNPRQGALLVGLIWSIENPDVVERCVELPLELRQGIEEDGFNLSQDNRRLSIIYGDIQVAHLRATLQDRYHAWRSTSDLSDEERSLQGTATPEQCKTAVVKEIGAEIKGLKEFKEKQKFIQSKRTEVEILRQRVPDSPGLDRLLRYTTSLERAFDRMLNQYDRAQRTRKGQPLPPQLDVKIS